MPSTNSPCLHITPDLHCHPLVKRLGTPWGQLVSDARHPQQREITLLAPSILGTEHWVIQVIEVVLYIFLVRPIACTCISKLQKNGHKSNLLTTSITWLRNDAKKGSAICLCPFMSVQKGALDRSLLPGSRCKLHADTSKHKERLLLLFA